MNLPKWQYITHNPNADDLLTFVRKLCNYGCPWVQFRSKDSLFEEKLYLAQEIKKICTENRALFIVNDDVIIAQKTKADGVHLGQEDMNIEDARKILGKRAIIGATANTFHQIKDISKTSANYIGLGPFAYTKTKKKLHEILGIEGLFEILQQVKKHHIHLPIFAVGGIQEKDIENIMKTGAYGIAVSGLMQNSPDTKQLIEYINKTL